MLCCASNAAGSPSCESRDFRFPPIMPHTPVSAVKTASGHALLTLTCSAEMANAATRVFHCKHYLLYAEHERSERANGMVPLVCPSSLWTRCRVHA